MKKFDLTEFNKLRSLLDEAGIPYVCDIQKEKKSEREARTQFTTAFGDYPMDRYQLIYPDATEQNRRSDVVIGYGTYGHEDGLLEQMGLLSDNIDDSVEGWLNAETVFQRWKADFEGSK